MTMTTPSRLCYQILVQGTHGSEFCYQTYWAISSDLGLAIGYVIEAARTHGIADPVPCRATLVADVPDNAVDLRDGVLFCHDEMYTCPLDPSDDPFQFPSGIIPCDDGDQSDPDEIVEAYVVDTQEFPIDVEVVVDRRRLLDTFFSLLRWLPSASAIEVRIRGHWDNTHKTGIWLSPDWDSHEVILKYIDDRQPDLLMSGYVDIAIYCRPERATLRLTHHKTIVFLADNRTGVGRCVSKIQDLGFSPIESALMIGRGFCHYHYRLPNSHDRASLITELEDDGFRYVKSTVDEQYGRD